MSYTVGYAPVDAIITDVADNFRKRSRADPNIFSGNPLGGAADIMERVSGAGVSSRRQRRRSRSVSLPSGPIRRFRRPKRVKPMSKTSLFGIRHEREIWGENIMKDCNYTGFLSHLPRVIGFDVGIAWIKWLYFRHYGVQFTSVHDKLNTPWTIVSGIYTSNMPTKIEFFYTDKYVNSGTATTIDHQSAPTSFASFDTFEGTNPYNFKTLYDFGVWFRDTVFFNNNFLSVTSKYLSHYRVYDQAAGNSSNIAHNMLDITEQYLHVYATTVFTLQNQTVADGGTGDAANNTDRVDINPIHGKMLMFNGFMPLIRNHNDSDSYPALLSSDLAMTDGNGSNDGVLAPRVNPSGPWRAPPAADMFSNCIRQRTIMMQPGQMKKGSIRYNFKGKLQTLMKMLNDITHTSGQNAIHQSNRRTGNCILFAFEKAMRTGSSKDITLAWHCDRYSGARITGTKLVPMKKYYTQEVGATDFVNNPTND